MAQAQRETTRNGTPPVTATPWLSLKEASGLTGLSRRDLRARIAAGELAAKTIRRGDKVEHRLTRAALVEVGLIGDERRQAAVSTDAQTPTPDGATPTEEARAAQPSAQPFAQPSAQPSGDTLAELIGLIREQNLRIASLEDQRAQLAARLGATVEAMHQLEDRLEAILDARGAPQLPDATDGRRQTDDGLPLPVGVTRTAAATPVPPVAQTTELIGVRRSLRRIVRDVAQPRLRELTLGVRRDGAVGE